MTSLEYESALAHELEDEFETLPSLESEWEMEGESEWEAVQREIEREIIGKDQRVLVPNTRAFPFRFICNIEFKGWPGCTGTLIAPSTVLTAGHCLRRFKASEIRVIPGRQGSLEPLPASGAARLFVMPGWSAVTPTDIGIIHLTHPIGKSVGYWSVPFRRMRGDDRGTSISTRPLPVEAGKLKINLSGYPADMPPSGKGCRTSAKTSLCHNTGLGAPGRSRLCGAYQYRAYDRTVAVKGQLLHYLDDTCPGHSGSPVWVKRVPEHGGRVMVGVHLGVSGGSNVAARITPAVMRFITAHLR